MRRRAELVVAAGIVLALAWAYARVTAGGEVLYYQDLLSDVYPLARLLAASYRAHELPLWNPWIMCGAPLAAQGDVAAFYPPVAIVLAGDPSRTYPWYLLLHEVIAAAGAAFLARSLGRSRVAALLAGAAFALTGTLIADHSFPREFCGDAWLPWVLAWLVRASSRRGRPLDILAAGGCLGALLLAGGFEPAYLGAIGAACFGLAALARARRGRPRAFATTVARAAAAGAIGLAIAAIQVAPLAAFIRASTRSAGVEGADASAFELHPARLLEAAVPDVFGTLLPSFGWTARRLLGPGEAQPWHTTIYMGAVALFLASVAATVRRSRGRWPAVALGAVSLVLATGDRTLPGAALRAVMPGIKFFRFPEKFVIGLALAVALLAAAGADGVRRAAPRARSRLAALAFAWAVAVAVAAHARGLFGVDIVAPSAGRAAEPAILALVVAGALLLTPLRGRALVAALALLVAADLGRVAEAQLFSVPRAALPAELWAPARMRELARDAPPPGSPAPLDRFVRRPSSGGFDVPLNLARGPAQFVFHEEALTSDAGAGLCYGVDGFVPAWMARFRRFWEAYRGPPEPVLALLGVRFRLERAHDDPPATAPDGARLVAHEPLFDLALYELSARLPRAFLATRAVAFRADEQVLARMRESPIEPWREVLVSDGAAAEGPRVLCDAPAAPATVRIERYEPGAVAIRVDSPGGGALVLADTFDPGWTATLDDVRAPILPAFGLVRAVLVPPGHHAVRMRYLPRAVVGGAAISAAACAALVIALFVLMTRHRRIAKSCN